MLSLVSSRPGALHRYWRLSCNYSHSSTKTRSRRIMTCCTAECSRCMLGSGLDSSLKSSCWLEPERVGLRHRCSCLLFPSFSGQSPVLEPGLISVRLPGHLYLQRYNIDIERLLRVVAHCSWLVPFGHAMVVGGDSLGTVMHDQRRGAAAVS